MINGNFYLSYEIIPVINTFPTSYRAPQTKIVCQSYAPKKLINQATQNRVHKIVGFSTSGVSIFYFIYVKKSLILIIIFFQMSVAITSLLRDKLPPF
jgi:hypothetical protein